MRRLGNVSACRRVGVCSNHQLCRDLLIIVAGRKTVLLRRRDADPLPQPAAHFERNDVTIIREAVH